MISSTDERKPKKIIKGSNVEIVYSNEDKHSKKTKRVTLRKTARNPIVHGSENKSFKNDSNLNLKFSRKKASVGKYGRYH